MRKLITKFVLALVVVGNLARSGAAQAEVRAENQPSLHTDVRVLWTSAARAAYEELAPLFERESGNRLVADVDLSSELRRKIDAGTTADVVVLPDDVAPLIRLGKVVAESRTVLGRYGIGIAVPQGAPRPDVSTVAAFRRALIDAKAIATSGEGASGRYVDTLIDRLGIAAEVKPKIKTGPAGSAPEFVARHEVDFAVIGLPPVAGTPGIEWAGLIPDELQNWQVFTAGLLVAAPAPQAGRALLAFLSSPVASAVLQRKGLEPIAP